MTKLSTLLAASAAAGTLALTGCGNSEGDQQSNDAQQQSTTQAESPSTESAGDSQSEKGGSVQTAQSAIELAEKEIDGKATELDFDDSRWEINVIKGSEKHEVVVSPEGTEVVKKEKDDDPADQEDVDALKKVKTPLKDALGTAVDEKGGGTVDEADLTTGSSPAWEVEVYPEGETDSVDVYVSAADGKVTDK